MIELIIDNRQYWFLDPRGNRKFVSIGVNHIQPDCWLAPYNRDASLKRYGNDLETPEGGFNLDGMALKKLMSVVRERLNEWHFNTLGVHTYGIPNSLYGDLYYAVFIDAVTLGSRFDYTVDRFPDVFSQAFERELFHTIAKVCAEHKINPNLLGYAFSDIPRWYYFKGELELYPERAIRHPWLNDVLKLPANAPGKQVWVTILQQQYPSSQAAGSTYGFACNNWDEVAARTAWPWPRDTSAAARDSESFMAAAATQWYRLHCEFIRKLDPGRLIFGDKLHSPHRLPEWMVALTKKYADVLFIQWYDRFEAQRETLISLHRRTVKPILNGDSSFACLKLPHQTRVKGTIVDTPLHAGQLYAEYLKGIMSLPFMLGWHHCGYMEQWDGAHAPDSNQLNENGFMDPFEVPYAFMIELVSQANRQAHVWHAASRL